MQMFFIGTNRNYIDIVIIRKDSNKLDRCCYNNEEKEGDCNSCGTTGRFSSLGSFETVLMSPGGENTVRRNNKQIQSYFIAGHLSESQLGVIDLTCTKADFSCSSFSLSASS